MIRRLGRSLQFRLATRLAAIYIAATAVAFAILIYSAYETAGSLDERELSLRAADLAKYVAVDPSGTARLDLPPALKSAYDSASQSDLFAVRSRDDKLIAASNSEFGALVAGWPQATSEPAYFRLPTFGNAGLSYYGMTIAQGSAAGPVSISVGRAAESDTLVHSVVREFVIDIAWIMPVFILITLATGVWVIRSGLKPLTDVSRMAASIGPASTAVRLPDGNLPTEIIPLVNAVNLALQRLEHGFTVQRQFTANAAHELRTPLAVITAELELIGNDGALRKLKQDVARMNRLVDQLLRVARLDGVALDVSQTVEINEVAAEVVGYMAPLAVAQGRSVAFSEAGEPVRVQGNRHAIGDAVRNLVENALAHTPPATEVAVEVHADRSIIVRDQGNGIGADEKEHIFKRFWRGRSAGAVGSGLGLAIVAEVMKAHGGRVELSDNLPKGTIFKLAFPHGSQPSDPEAETR